MGFTKFCAALLNHPDTELQAIPQTMLEQVLCSAPRSPHALGTPRAMSLSPPTPG